MPPDSLHISGQLMNFFLSDPPEDSSPYSGLRLADQDHRFAISLPGRCHSTRGPDHSVKREKSTRPDLLHLLTHFTRRAEKNTQLHRRTRIEIPISGSEIRPAPRPRSANQATGCDPQNEAAPPKARQPPIGMSITRLTSPRPPPGWGCQQIPPT